MRKVGINYKCLCQGMLFPLLQSIVVEVSGHKPEISHPKFKINKRPKSRISSAGTNKVFHSILCGSRILGEPGGSQNSRKKRGGSR